MLLNAVKVFFLTSALFLGAASAAQEEEVDQGRRSPVASREIVPKEEMQAVQNAVLATQILDELRAQEDQDPVELFKALQQSAKLGNQDALYFVARMMEQGVGCAHTERGIYNAYAAAAEAMHPEALCWMGNHFSDKGEHETALEFYDLATQQGCPRTADLAEILRAEMAA